MFFINGVSTLITLYTACLAVYALLSWFPGAYQSSFGRLLSNICEPYLRLFDRLNLSFGGLSFNIMIAIFVLQVGGKLLIRILWTILY